MFFNKNNYLQGMISMVWAKGQSGNPAGLTILQARTKRAIEGLSIRAVQRLEKLVDSDNEAIALGAIKEVLGRTNPVPKQASLSVQVTHTDAHLMALKQLADKTREKLIDVTPVRIDEPERKPESLTTFTQSEASEVFNVDQVIDLIDESDEPNSQDTD